MRLLLSLLAIVLLLPGPAFAQPEPPARRLTLQQAIAIAREESPNALVARHRYRGAYWSFVTHKADFRPSLDLDATAFSLQRTIQRQTLPDGRDAFVPTSNTSSLTELSLNKILGFSGGTISLRSGFERSEELEGSREVSYLANPVALSYRQPIFTYNTYKWNARIEPRRFRESRQTLIEDLEGITANTISYFFDLLSAQTTLADAAEDDANAEQVLTAARERFASGRAPENEVLQAELSRLNANLRLSRVQVDLAVRQQRLASHLGLPASTTFDLVPPTDVPKPRVDLARAQAEARRNRSQAMGWERQLIEADRGIAQAKSGNGSASLYASYGLTQSASKVNQLYRNPTQDQVASLSIELPILDWGRNRARIAVAESNREVVRRQVAQSQDDFDRDIFLRVSQFQIQAQQLRIATLADSIAQRRHELTRTRYIQGQGDLNSVQIAQNERDNARRGYVDGLRSYWAAYVDVRRATLYDFERGTPLIPPAVEP